MYLPKIVYSTLPFLYIGIGLVSFNIDRSSGLGKFAPMWGILLFILSGMIISMRKANSKNNKVRLQRVNRQSHYNWDEIPSTNRPLR